MGAQYFVQTGHGSTAKEAYREAVERAKHNYGHGGYTGTMAESSEGFKMVSCPEGMEPAEYAWSDECQNRFDDKWGKCGCIDLGNDKYLFFGSAPS